MTDSNGGRADCDARVGTASPASRATTVCCQDCQQCRDGRSAPEADQEQQFLMARGTSCTGRGVGDRYGGFTTRLF